MIVVVIAITATITITVADQSELASYLSRVGYDKSFLLLYLTHSSYWIIGVAHYVALRFWLNEPVGPLLLEMQDAVRAQLGVHGTRQPFPVRRAALRIFGLTLIIALPAAFWYFSVPLTSMTSLTALYNLNA